MKNSKSVILIYIISLLISLLGFYLDDDVKNRYIERQSIATNIFEISLISIIIFFSILIIYLGINKLVFFLQNFR
jgi:hypothetical protein